MSLSLSLSPLLLALGLLGFTVSQEKPTPKTTTHLPSNIPYLPMWERNPDFFLIVFVSFLISFLLVVYGLDRLKGKQETIRMTWGDHCKMVLIIRTDLGMGKGKVAAQCSHATLAAYQIAQKKSEQTRKWLAQWDDGGCAKITLKCLDEKEMLALEKASKKEGLVAVSIQDAGKTQIAAGSRTVLAIGPGPKDAIDFISGHLKLY
jgi:peptidyl-tRNA hydrolase